MTRRRFLLGSLAVAAMPTAPISASSRFFAVLKPLLMAQARCLRIIGAVAAAKVEAMMQVQAKKPHMYTAAGRPMSRPPASPEEIDNPHHDVLVALGWLAAAVLVAIFIGLVVAAVFSLAPVTL